MKFLNLIERKRDGGCLDPEEIGSFVAGVVAEELPREQISAFLMAILFRGLSDEERRHLTLSMRDSGETLSWAPDSKRPVVDKHSTGGVGDKVSLPLAPLLACLGFRVPMISGRGLGITGGTLDKLESIPGFSTRLERDRIVELVETTGLAMAGQTARMVPADRILYALRDVTGTVPSQDLITASILSKKLAEGLDALVLDVKFGAAAFMRRISDAEALAKALTQIAHGCGVDTRAVLTQMDTPLGRAAGNWLEVRESVDCLQGRGPSDLRELVLLFAGSLLEQTGRSASKEEGIRLASTVLDSGAPLAKWESMIAAQGGDLDAYHRLLLGDSAARVVLEVPSSSSGFVDRCDAREIGEVVRALGAGRLSPQDAILAEVGIDRLAKSGDPVRAGDVLVRIHAPEAGHAEEARHRLLTAITVSDRPPEVVPLVRA